MPTRPVKHFTGNSGKNNNNNNNTHFPLRAIVSIPDPFKNFVLVVLKEIKDSTSTNKPKTTSKDKLNGLLAPQRISSTGIGSKSDLMPICVCLESV